MEPNLYSEVYDQLNKAWKAACRVLFGEEVGELKDYEEWLVKYTKMPRNEESAVSGKKVTLSNDNYCKDAKFVIFDEIDLGKKFEPLSINEVKDIDMILESLQERFYYSGNILLGNSRFIEDSSNVTDSFYVRNSSFVDEAQYASCSEYIRSGKYLFGAWGGIGEYLIKGFIATKCQRCFEYLLIRFSSDLFYSANIEGCSDCIFCFNLNGKRRHIGNLELPIDKYAELKRKLLSEITADLRRKRSVPSLVDIVSGFPRETIDIRAKEQEEIFDVAPVDDAFRKTFKVLFGKEIVSLKEYDSYLASKMQRLNVLKTNETSSRKELLLFDGYKSLLRIKNRAISWAEACAYSENPKKLGMNEVERLSLADPTLLSKIAYVPPDYVVGKNHNIGKTEFYMDASDCYHGASFVLSKSSAYCWWPRESSHAFGSTVLINSSFCIGSHYSTKLTRAFETDSCNNCSDIYFGHNCDNVHDSMFCFNVKNKTRAIGNAELPPEQYKVVKENLVGQMADELIKKKGLKWNIYNIGCAGKNAV